jgi:hypothetical protein
MMHQSQQDMKTVQRKVFIEVRSRMLWGKKIPVYLTDVLHAPGLNLNLFSITKCINKPGIQFQGTHKFKF